MNEKERMEILEDLSSIYRSIDNNSKETIKNFIRLIQEKYLEMVIKK